MTTVSAERLARIFVEVADTMVDEFDLIDFLHMLADRTAGLVGASAVGLLLADHRGRLEFLAALDDADVPIVQALADVAAIGLLQERAIRRGELLTEQLQGALNSRVVIEQAKGAIARAHGVTVNDAFTMIRNHARRTNRRLVDVAHTILTDPDGLPELANP